MSLLSQASLVVVPSGYKEDVVYSVKPTDGSGDLTFTRASDGTRVNSQGLVERVPWNLLQQSNSFSTTWVLANATLTSGQSGYDGSSNAWLLAKTGDYGRVEQSTTTSGLLTLSVYAKAGTLDWLSFENSGIAADTCYFDLANGVVGSKGAGVVSTSIESIGGGWHRCSAVFNGTIGTTRIQPSISDGVVNGTNGNIYIQDAQLVEGSTAKPYFPTTDRLNVPRLDYSNGCPSLLLEPQRTNLALYSEQFDNGAWSKSGVTITANNTTSPDGTQNADLLDDGTANASHYVNINVTTASSTTYVQSAYFKKKDSGIYASLRTNGVGSNSFVVFDFDTASVVGVGTQIDDYGVVSYANGWYRVWMKYTLAPTGYIIGVSNNSSSAIPSYTGTNKGFYVWGAQLEASSYPTSYIPTTTASVTRVADAASKTGISSLIGQTEGVLYIELEGVNYSPTGGAQFCSIDDGTSLKRMELFANTSNLIGVYVQDVIAQVNFTSAVPATGRIKIALAYKLNDYALYVNGNLVHTDTSGTVPTVSALRLFGRYDGLANGSQAVNQAVLFKTRLTNAELASLTTL